MTSSEFRTVMYPGRSFQLEIFLQWLQIAESIKSTALKYFMNMLNAGRRFKAASWHLPLAEADEIAVGKPVKVWREWLTHTEPEDEWWAAEDYSGGVADVTAPNHLISGWYDFMLPQLLRDYTSLQQAGRKPYLTVGPGSHSSSSLLAMGMQESIPWLRAHLLGEMELLRASPVRIYVMGANEWRDLPAWPPAEVQPQHWYLQPEGALSVEIPVSFKNSIQMVGRRSKSLEDWLANSQLPEVIQKRLSKPADLAGILHIFGEIEGGEPATR